MATRVTLGPRRNISPPRDARLGADPYWHLVYDSAGYLIYSFTSAGFFAQAGHNTPGTHALQNIVDTPANGVVCGHWAGKTANSLGNYHTYAYALVTATDVTSTSMDSTYSIGVMGNLAESGANMQPNVLYVFSGTAFTLPTGTSIECANGQLITTGAFVIRGYVMQGVLNAAIADVNFVNSSMNAWVDEAGNSLKFKVKYSNGTIKTGSVALV